MEGGFYGIPIGGVGVRAVVGAFAWAWSLDGM